MIYSEEFFKKLPEDAVEAIKEICKKYFEFLESINNDRENDYYEDYLDAFAALEAFILSKNFEDEFQIPQIEFDEIVNKRLIGDFFVRVYDLANRKFQNDYLESARFKYKSQMSLIFSYRFTDGDLSRIQELINELRDLISNSELFENGHRERLLKRLENLQKELHKKMSNLDKFWGLIGDAGIVLGKFGTDVKPFVDRIKEIVEIVWRTQASAEELPSGTNMPMLNKEN